MKTIMILCVTTLLAMCSIARGQEPEGGAGDAAPDTIVPIGTVPVNMCQMLQTAIETHGITDPEAIADDKWGMICPAVKALFSRSGDDRDALSSCDESLQKFFAAAKNKCPKDGHGDVDAERPEGGVDAERPEGGVDAERPEGSVDAERPEGGVDAERPGGDGVIGVMPTPIGSVDMCQTLKMAMETHGITDPEAIAEDKWAMVCPGMKALLSRVSEVMTGDALSSCEEKMKKFFGAVKNKCPQSDEEAGDGDGKGKWLLTCETPTEATDENCQQENRDQVEGACRSKLFMECIKNGMVADCDREAVPAGTCDSTESYQAFVKEKPECFVAASRVCAEKKAENSIPMDCTSWFDGCNDCVAADGSANAEGCITNKFCEREDTAKAFCKSFKDGKTCTKEDGLLACAKDGQVIPEEMKEKLSCEDVTSRFDVTTGPEDICKRVLILCGKDDNPDLVANCEVEKDNDFAQKCMETKDKEIKTDEDKRKQALCCVQGQLSGETSCKDYGGADALPEDCARCVENGELKKEADCMRCRGKDGLRVAGLTGGDETKQPFDPARVKETIREVVSELGEDGETCFKRVAESASLIRTEMQRWRNDNPSQEEEAPEDLVIKSVADVQAELDSITDDSTSLEDEFAADEAGETFRAAAENAGQMLREKISDDNKPTQCAAEFAALKEAYNNIVDEYAGLPQKLKADGVERVSLKFEDRDIGSTDLTDAKSVCGFAMKLVSGLKKAEDNHKKRLAEARKVVCIKGGKMIKDGLLNNLSKCLRDAKKTAEEGTDAAATQVIQDDITKFDNNGFQRVDKLVRLMTKKCLMKDTPTSKLARVANLFKGKLRTTIARKAAEAGGALTTEEKQAIAEKISTAVRAKHAAATNIETIFPVDEGRRQLRPRRLADTVIETTYDLNTPALTSDEVAVDFGADSAFNVVATGISFEPSAATIEGTEPIQEIDTQLPTGESATGGEVTPPSEGDGGAGESATGGEVTPPSEGDGGAGDGGEDDGGKDDGGEPAADGAQGVVFGAVAAIAAVLFV